MSTEPSPLRVKSCANRPRNCSESAKSIFWECTQQGTASKLPGIDLQLLSEYASGAHVTLVPVLPGWGEFTYLTTAPTGFRRGTEEYQSTQQCRGREVFPYQSPCAACAGTKSFFIGVVVGRTCFSKSCRICSKFDWIAPP